MHPSAPGELAGANPPPPALPALCFGTSPLAGMPGTYGYDVDEARARRTIHRILQGPYPFLDTSRNYGFGRAEERVGAVLRELGGLPEGALISTKLDRDMDTGRFGASEARRSVEESLEALGVTSVAILHLHDPEHAASLNEVIGEGGAMRELERMKREGLAERIGLAAGNVDVMLPIVRTFELDVMITHSRYTLLNRNAEALMDEARARDILIMNAAPYSGGVLAKGSENYPRYVYQHATDAVLEPVRQVEALCQHHSVPVGAAALQFSMRDPRIAATICGVSRPERVEQTLEWAAFAIPDAFWDALSSLPFSREDPEASRVYQPD